MTEKQRSIEQRIDWVVVALFCAGLGLMIGYAMGNHDGHANAIVEQCYDSPQ